MGNVVRDFSVNAPIELEDDPVEATWSALKKFSHLGRQVAPPLLGMASKITASASATNALFALGAANILTLYVNIWMAIGGAYSAAREETRVDGLLMGYATGFGHRLAGSYDPNELEWRHDTSNRATKFHRDLAEIQKRAFNSGRIKGSSGALHLKNNHKLTIIGQLNHEVAKRYPSNWKQGDRYASFINHNFDQLREG